MANLPKGRIPRLFTRPFHDRQQAPTQPTPRPPFSAELLPPSAYHHAPGARTPGCSPGLPTFFQPACQPPPEAMSPAQVPLPVSSRWLTCHLPWGFPALPLQPDKVSPHPLSLGGPSLVLPWSLLIYLSPALNCELREGSVFLTHYSGVLANA